MFGTDFGWPDTDPAVTIPVVEQRFFRDLIEYERAISGRVVMRHASVIDTHAPSDAYIAACVRGKVIPHDSFMLEFQESFDGGDPVIRDERGNSKIQRAALEPVGRQALEAILSGCRPEYVSVRFVKMPHQKTRDAHRAALSPIDLALDRQGYLIAEGYIFLPHCLEHDPVEVHFGTSRHKGVSVRPGYLTEHDREWLVSGASKYGHDVTLPAFEVGK